MTFQSQVFLKGSDYVRQRRAHITRPLQKYTNVPINVESFSHSDIHLTLHLVTDWLQLYIMMESGWLLQAAFVLWTLSLSKAQDVVGPGLTCLRSSSADGQTRVTFLRKDTAGALSLFLTMWSEDMRLVTCQIYTNSRITEVYRAHCDTTESQHREMIQKFDISVVMAPDAPCVLVSSWTPEFTNRTRRDGAERKARRKRSWIFPGTLWCGSGSKAVGYEQLGEGVKLCFFSLLWSFLG